MKKLCPATVILLTFFVLTLPPLWSLPIWCIEKENLKDIRESFFQNDKINISATGKTLWSIMNDPRFKNEAYQGGAECDGKGFSILKGVRGSVFILSDITFPLC